MWKQIAALLGRLLESPVYLVGGAVRDLLRGEAPKDLDFATPLLPEEVARKLGAAGFPVDPKGIHHGTVATVVKGMEVEVTTFRVDLHTDGRRAEVAFTKDIVLDLARRDFTVNAMALSPEGELVDPFGGKEDLERGVLRAVGDPGARFREDYLRVVRLARFASGLDLTPEEETWKAALEAAPRVLGHVSLPRMGEELTKGLQKGRGRFVRLLFQLGLLYRLFPELEGPFGPAHRLLQNPLHHPEGDVLAHLEEALDRLDPGEADPALAAWATFLHDVGKPATAEPTGEGWYRFPRHEAVGGEMVEGIARRFGFSRRWAEAVGTAVRLHMRPLQPPTPRAVRRFQAEAGEHLPLLRAVCYADGEGRREDLEAWFRPQGVPLSPLLQGRDLLALGLEPGPRIGQLLRRASELQLELGLGSKDAVLEALRQEGLIP